MVAGWLRQKAPLMWLVAWYLRHRERKFLSGLGLSGAQVGKTMKILDYLVNLRFIPKGWGTRLPGWLALANAVRCAAGLVLPGCPCSPDPGQALLSGLLGTGLLGLARRDGKVVGQKVVGQ
jgi:hypothetical protein